MIELCGCSGDNGEDGDDDFENTLQSYIILSFIIILSKFMVMIKNESDGDSMTDNHDGNDDGGRGSATETPLICFNFYEECCMRHL